jgi:hypothetical protein
VPLRHLAEDHRGAVVSDQRLAAALGIGVAPVGGCDFLGCNEDEGLDDRRAPRRDALEIAYCGVTGPVSTNSKSLPLSCFRELRSSSSQRELYQS